MWLYEVLHETTYTYGTAASVSYNRAHLKPRPCAHQRLGEHHYEIAPEPTGPVQVRDDYFGNPVYYFSVQKPHARLSMPVRSIIELEPTTYIEPSDTPPWEKVRDTVRYGAD